MAWDLVLLGLSIGIIGLIWMLVVSLWHSSGHHPPST